jgi:hypothetical protein
LKPFHRGNEFLIAGPFDANAEVAPSVIAAAARDVFLIKRRRLILLFVISQ